MKKWLFVVLLIPILIIFDIYFIEPNLVLVKNEKVFLKNWDKSLDGYKIGILTDLHVGTYRVNCDKLRSVVKKINKQNLDLIVLLGDLDAKTISQKNYSENEIADILSDLRAKDGIIAILGNHDFQPKGIVKCIYKKSGIPVLENTKKMVFHNGNTICVYGLKDWWHNKYNPSDVITENNYPVIVLSHNPDTFPKIPSFVSITLSGHTHGGEIYFPFVGSPFIPSEYGQKYNKGLIIENGNVLYVCGGIASLSRLRFFNPPEISVLSLYSSNGQIKDTKVKKGFRKNYAGFGLKYLKKLYKLIKI